MVVDLSRGIALREGVDRLLDSLCVEATVFRPIYPTAPMVELGPEIRMIQDDEARCVRVRVHDPRMTDAELAESVERVRGAVCEHGTCAVAWVVTGSNA
jgi:hypothetical protein